MLSEVLKDNESFRFDAEFFSKKFILIDKILNKYNHLDEIADTYELHSNGSFASVFDILHDGNETSINYIKSTNIGDFFIEGELEKISLTAHKKLSKTKTVLGDILTARTGKVGGASLITNEWINSNSNQNVVNIRLKTKEILSMYLVTFLNCSYGINQFLQASTGNVQPWLNLSLLRKVKIPIFSNTFQTQIENLVKSAYQKLEESKTLYKQAENLLLKELDLLDFKPTTQNISIKSFSESFGSSGRLDSEYYLSKYIEYIEILKNYKYGWKPIQEILTNDIKSGTTPKGIIKKYIPNSNYFFRAEAFNNDLTLTYENLYSMSDKIFQNYPNLKVNKNDILVSMTGTIGSVAIVTKKIDGIINQNIVKLSANKEIINHTVLALYIKIVGKTLLTREQTGNVQPYVNIPNFSNLIVPLIDKQIQTQIENKIKESFRLKEKSKELLELAKRGVEVAIEEGEEVAIKFIKEKR